MTSQDDGLHRAEVLLELRRPHEALSLMAAVIASRPDDVEALLLAGRCHAALDHPQDCLDIAQRAVSVAPEDARARIALADALYDLGRYDASRAAAEAAVTLAPHDWRTHYMLSRSLSAGEHPLPARALLSAREAKRLAPYSADAHVAAGLAYSVFNMPGKARAEYREALRLDPHHQYALGNLSILLAARGRFAAASEHVRAGLVADPQAAHLHATYAHVIVRLYFTFTAIHLLASAVICIGLLSGMPWWLRGLVAAAPITVCAASLVRVSRRLPGGPRSLLTVVGSRTNRAQQILLAFWGLATVSLALLGALPPHRAHALAEGVVDVAGATPWHGILLMGVVAGWAGRTTQRK